MGRKKVSLQEMQRAYAHHGSGIQDTDKLFRRLLEDIGRISRPVRKHSDLSDSMLISLMERLMVIWNASVIDIAEAAWHKFPNACPYCLKKRDCSCIKMKVKPKINDRELDKLRADKSRAPKTIGDFQKMLKRIFGHINKKSSLENIWLHFIEECRELSEELSCGNYSRAVNESGDVFAWLIAMANALGIDLEKEIKI